MLGCPCHPLLPGLLEVPQWLALWWWLWCCCTRLPAVVTASGLLLPRHALLWAVVGCFVGSWYLCGVQLGPRQD